MNQAIEISEGEQVCNDCGDVFVVFVGEFATPIDPENPLCGVCRYNSPHTCVGCGTSYRLGTRHACARLAAPR